MLFDKNVDSTCYVTFTKYRIVQRRGKCHKRREEDRKGKN